MIVFTKGSRSDQLEYGEEGLEPVIMLLQVEFGNDPAHKKRERLSAPFQNEH